MDKDTQLIWESYISPDNRSLELLNEQYDEWWEEIILDELDLSNGYYIGYQSGSKLKINDTDYTTDSSIRGMNFPYIIAVKGGRLYKHYIPHIDIESIPKAKTKEEKYNDFEQHFGV